MNDETNRKDSEQDSNLELVQDKSLKPCDAATPLQMVQLAIEKGFDIERLKTVMELERQWKADLAREAFVKAMAEFRGKAVTIIKNKTASFGTGANATSYGYADLANAVEAAVPALSECGLSTRWETRQADNQITVTCILTHALGHSEETTLTAAPDTSGSKNAIQAIGSTLAYLERYTFLAATGLAAKGMDNDGGGSQQHETLDENQVAELNALITEVGATKHRFLKHCKVDSLDEILAINYSFAVKDLERKRSEPERKRKE